MYPMSDGGHGGMPPSPGQINGAASIGPISRQLKRLSLPLVQTKPRNGNGVGPVAWQDLFRPDSASSQAPPSSYQYRSGSISSANSLGGGYNSNSKGENSSPSSTPGVDEFERTRLGLNASPEDGFTNQPEEGIESLTSPTLSHSSLL